MEHVSPEPNTGCWIWTGALDHQGYGVFCRFGKRAERAHRVAFALHHGREPLPGDLLHSCDHRWCVSPYHTSEGDRLANMQDAARKGRTARGERHGGHKLNEAEVLMVRERLAHGATGAALARELHVSPMTISFIRAGKRWGWLLPKSVC